MIYTYRYNPKVTVSNDSDASSGNIKLDISDDTWIQNPRTVTCVGVNRGMKQEKTLSDRKINKMIQMRK